MVRKEKHTYCLSVQIVGLNRQQALVARLTTSADQLGLTEEDETDLHNLSVMLDDVATQAESHSIPQPLPGGGGR